MTQLRQRISLVIRVAPLNKEEISAYIDHRLSIAGCKDSKLFTPGARGLIAEYSEGIPRKINTVCFNAMSLACALRRNAIDRGTVLEVIADLDLESLIDKPLTPGEIVEERPIRVVSAPQRPAETTERNNPWLGGWAPRLAVVGALVLTVATGVQPSDVLAVNTIGKIDDLALRQEFVPQQQPANPAPVASSREQVQESVRVLQGQSLYRISVDNLGRYDPKVLTEIRNLNPWLSDPDYIRVGQQVLMPSVPMSSASTELRVSQEFSSSPREASKE